MAEKNSPSFFRKAIAKWFNLSDANDSKQALYAVNPSAAFTVSYDGEKNIGEMGPARNYVMDYQMMAIRSWQAYVESDIAKTVLDRFNVWSIGTGLKLQCEANTTYLKSEKIEGFDNEEFSKVAEARWKVYAGSRYASHSQEMTLHKLASLAKHQSQIGGDCLIILRVENDIVTAQLIDGMNIVSPLSPNLANGNKIIHGVEVDASGKHVAYHIRKKGTYTETTRVEAYGKKSGQRMAFMVYGHRYRVDSTRGMPLIGVVLETMKKLERYKEATVTSAEERAKIVYYIYHENFSTGENPLVSQLAKAWPLDSDPKNNLPEDVNGTQLEDKFAATTGGQAMNMPIGAKLQSLETKNDLYFADFFDKNIDIICAAVGIPPNVAMSKYDDSFSASRAALMDWQHSLKVVRQWFSDDFYKPIYTLWMHMEVLSNKIQAVGYLDALANGKVLTVEAYLQSRWVGAMVPHIDPLKEVKAIREKLGADGAKLPLTTVEQATEDLDGGDSDRNMEQFSNELETYNELNPSPEPPAPTNPPVVEEEVEVEED